MLTPLRYQPKLPGMGTTVRIPEALKERAAAYADDLGISLNALLAVALKDYLDDRQKPAVDAASTVPETPPSSESSAEPAGLTRQQRRAMERKAAKGGKR